MLYLAFLRGINVGGHTVKMEYLRELFRDLGYENVRSYIQSGNVFFETGSRSRAAVTSAISEHLRENLGYEVAVCLRTLPEMEEMLALDPFRDVELTDDRRFCVVFGARPLPPLALPLMSPKKDLEIIGTTKLDAFVIWHLIDGRPPAAKGFLDNTLGADATTRFFHTLVKIVAAAKKPS